MSKLTTIQTQLSASIIAVTEAENAVETNKALIIKLRSTKEIKEWIFQETKKPSGMWKRIEETLKTGMSKATLERWLSPVTNPATLKNMKICKKLRETIGDNGKPLSFRVVSGKTGVAVGTIKGWQDNGWVNNKIGKPAPNAKTETEGKNAEVEIETPTGEVVSLADRVTLLEKILADKSVKAVAEALGYKW